MFSFQIRPLRAGQGYELSCEGVLHETVRYSKLLHALMEAAQRGKHLAGAIEIFDARGELMEVLPLQSGKALNRAFHACKP
jgi:hypothetical protein